MKRRKPVVGFGGFYWPVTHHVFLESRFGRCASCGGLESDGVHKLVAGGPSQ